MKNRSEVSEARICEIIDEIDTFLARDADTAVMEAAA